MRRYYLNVGCFALFQSRVPYTLSQPHTSMSNHSITIVHRVFHGDETSCVCVVQYIWCSLGLRMDGWLDVTALGSSSQHTPMPQGQVYFVNSVLLSSWALVIIAIHWCFWMHLCTQLYRNTVSKVFAFWTAHPSSSCFVPHSHST